MDILFAFSFFMHPYPTNLHSSERETWRNTRTLTHTYHLPFFACLVRYIHKLKNDQASMHDTSISLLWLSHFLSEWESNIVCARTRFSGKAVSHTAGWLYLNVSHFLCWFTNSVSSSLTNPELCGKEENTINRYLREDDNAKTNQSTATIITYPYLLM